MKVSRHQEWGRKCMEGPLEPLLDVGPGQSLHFSHSLHSSLGEESNEVELLLNVVSVEVQLRKQAGL
jgi:hypothetical protein